MGNRSRLTLLGRLRHAMVLIIVSVLYLPAQAGAQCNTAELSGIVKDAKGGVLPGVIVVALHVASGRRTERLSDGEGRFILPALPQAITRSSSSSRGSSASRAAGSR